MVSPNILWYLHTEKEIQFSKEWINEIFGYGKEYFIGSNDIVNNNTVIVVSSENRDDNFSSLIKQYNERDLNYIVLHLSDEGYSHDVSYYNICKNVVRNYYSEQYHKEYNVSTIPLGYKTGIKRVKSDKSYKVNFIGQVKSDRLKMMDEFRDMDNSYFRLTSYWNDEKFGLCAEDYSVILSSSDFTLCPMGWINMDSFRICESLQCNSIPVVVRTQKGEDYFENVFGKNHPFIISNTWKENREKIDNMSKEDIQSKKTEVSKFWNDFKYDLKNKFKSIWK